MSARVMILVVCLALTALIPQGPAAAQDLGLGDFPKPSLLLVGVNPSQGLGIFAVGDVDGDGARDLLVVGDAPAHLLALRGPLSAGTVPVSELMPIVVTTDAGATATVDLAVADLDGDGLDDVLFLQNPSTGPRVLVIRGDPSFFALDGVSLPPALPLTLDPPPRANSRLRFGDANADGLPDLLYRAQETDGMASELAIAFGPFEVRDTGVTPIGGLARIAHAESPDWGEFYALADLDADGVPDLLVSDRTSEERGLAGLRGPFLPDQQLAALDLDEMLTIQLDSRLTDLAVGDVDADGRADLIIGEGSANRVSIIPAFAIPPPGPVPLDRAALEVHAGPSSSTTGERLLATDVDGDGAGDLLVAAPGFDHDTPDGRVRNAGAVAVFLGAARPPTIHQVTPVHLPAGTSTVVTIRGTGLRDADVLLVTASGSWRQSAVLERSLGVLQVLVPVPRVLGPVHLELRIRGEAVRWDGEFSVTPAERVVQLRRGWNLVGWTGSPDPIQSATAALVDAFDLALTWNPGEGAFDFYRPATPDLGALRELRPGDALWVHATRDVTWTQPRRTHAAHLSLLEGLNLLTWTGPDETPVRDALASLGDALIAAHRWDPAGEGYRRFLPGVPRPLSDLTTLNYGDGLWIAVDRDAVWRQPSIAAPPVAASAFAAGPAVVLVTHGSREGSGFIISEQLIVTAAHIVRGTRSVEVRFPSGATATAIVVATDAPLDLALLAVPRIPPALPRLDWQSAPAPDPTQLVWVWGYPLGDVFGESTQPTVSAGIVSALQDNRRGFPVLQTDAAVANGSSGGPIVDVEGRALAVVISFLTRRGEDVEGLNLGADLARNRDRLNALLARASGAATILP